MADQVTPQDDLLYGLNRVGTKLRNQGGCLCQSLRTGCRPIGDTLSNISVRIQIGRSRPLLVVGLVLQVLVEVDYLLNARFPGRYGLLCQLNLRCACLHFSNLFGHYFVHKFKRQLPDRLYQSDLMVHRNGNPALATGRRRPQFGQPRIVLSSQSHLLFNGRSTRWCKLRNPERESPGAGHSAIL